MSDPSPAGAADGPQGRAGAAGEAERLRAALAEVTAREALLSKCVGMARLGCWRLDVRTGEAVFTSTCAEIYGLPVDVPMTLMSLSGLYVEADKERAAKAFTSCWAEGESFDIEVELVTSGNGRRWARIMGESIMSDGRVETIFGCVQDLTSRKELEHERERLALRDPLTDLPNRTQFHARLDAMRDGAPQATGRLGLALLDLDHFKDVNDTLGHDAGDAVLLALSQRLPSVLRPGDMLARLGGDEFGLILPDLPSEEAGVQLLDAAQHLLRAPIDFHGRQLQISTSIGLTVTEPGEVLSPRDLIKNADIALYEAKEAGRNCLRLFAPAMRTEVERRFEVLGEVSAGLDRDEFEMFYQPIVDIGAEQVAGFEALMRWRHPERGLLTPAVFGSAFDDPRLALRLGRVAIDHSLQQMRLWMDAGVPFGRVAVNVAPAQFRGDNLPRVIAERLSHWNVPPDRLAVEITENVYLGLGAESLARSVRALHDLGVQIALDDFGTGYASLANLRQFPIDRIKIDRSFIQEEDRAVIQAVLSLGAGLGVQVVAEGVEDTGQLDFLRRQGCAQAQGFHYARPMPAREVPDFLRRMGATAAVAA